MITNSRCRTLHNDNGSWDICFIKILFDTLSEYHQDNISLLHASDMMSVIRERRRAPSRQISSITVTCIARDVQDLLIILLPTVLATMTTECIFS